MSELLLLGGIETSKGTDSVAGPTLSWGTSAIYKFL